MARAQVPHAASQASPAPDVDAKAIADNARLDGRGADDRLAGQLARCVQQRALARWHVVASGNYAQASPAGSIGNPFTWQEEDVTVQHRPGGLPGRGIQYVQHTEAAPDLKVSADNSIAMQDAPGEVKEVYLDPQVRTAANAELAWVGSPIKLRKAGQTVTVDANGGVPQRTLERVRPTRVASAQNQGLNADDFPPLATIICRDVAQWVLGGDLTRIRLSDAHNRTRDVTSDTGGGSIVAGTQQLAVAVARGNLSLAEAAKKMALKKVPTPQKQYGKATGGKRFGERATALGINEHAWASPGQAYLIQSTYAKVKKGGVADAPQLVGGGFGYHFAAVVAASLDDQDAITLENYRRSGAIASAADELLRDLRTRYARSLVAAVSNVGDVPRGLRSTEEIGAILHYVEHNAAPDFGQAAAKWKVVLAELGNPSALWYFRMVSREDPEQSFHRQLSATGQYASPLTVVMIR